MAGLTENFQKASLDGLQLAGDVLGRGSLFMEQAQKHFPDVYELLQGMTQAFEDYVERAPDNPELIEYLRELIELKGDGAPVALDGLLTAEKLQIYDLVMADPDTREPFATLMGLAEEMATHGDDLQELDRIVDGMLGAPDMAQKVDVSAPDESVPAAAPQTPKL
jgi:hypothetical protein